MSNLVTKKFSLTPDEWTTVAEFPSNCSGVFVFAPDNATYLRIRYGYREAQNLVPDLWSSFIAKNEFGYHTKEDSYFLSPYSKLTIDMPDFHPKIEAGAGDTLTRPLVPWACIVQVKIKDPILLSVNYELNPYNLTPVGQMENEDVREVVRPVTDLTRALVATEGRYSSQQERAAAILKKLRENKDDY